MRNAFVVLVSLCIGVVSGFIVPSSTPETIDKNNISSTAPSTSEELKSMTTTKYTVLPKNRTNIDEKYLFEHATEQKNNQSERAYVYINQKYNRIKYPRNKLIKMLPMDNPGSGSAFGLPPPTSLSPQQTPCVTCQNSLSPGADYNSKYQGFHLEDLKHGQENILNLAAPDLFRWKFNENGEQNENVLKLQIPASNRVDDRRDFLELLKSPLLRPENRKINYEKVTKIDVPIVLPSSITPNSDNYIKELLKNQYVSKLKEAMARKNEIRRNYAFNGAFIRRPYELDEIRNRAEELSYINEEENRKKIEINQEEDRLLDKYLKDTLEDNLPLQHDRVRALPATPDCPKDDCVTPRKKYSKNKNVFIKPDCHCGRNMSFKKVDPFISNDRSLREDKRDLNETDFTSSEIMNYVEMLAENMVREDVVRPPNSRTSKSTLLR